MLEGQGRSGTLGKTSGVEWQAAKALAKATKQQKTPQNVGRQTEPAWLAYELLTAVCVRCLALQESLGSNLHIQI